MRPIDNEKSECFQCDAFMCSICRNDQYDYDIRNADANDFVLEKEVKKEPETIKKEIIVCHMCGWEHHDPHNWHRYERAPNGSLQKVCPSCGRISLLLRTREFLQ